MSDPCKFPACKFHPQKNGYCIGHRIYADHIPAKTVGIKKVSDKMKDVKAILRTMYPPYLAKNKKCKIGVEGVCTKKSTCVNHRNGRGKNEILNVATWEASCFECNGWIEGNHSIAEAAGHKVSRHVKH